MVTIRTDAFPSQSSFGGDLSLLQGSSEGGIGAPELASRPPNGGARGVSDAYPCLTGNNSMKVDAQDVRHLKSIGEKEREVYFEKVLPILSGYQKKATHRLQKSIEQAVIEFGIESFMVLHLTFAEEPTYQHAQDCINSLRSNVFAKRYSTQKAGCRPYNNFVTICERGGKNGRIHFHVLAIKQGADFKTGSYWSFNKRTLKKEFHPNSDCRSEWEYYREILKGYGFGDHVRVEPLQTVEGGSRYFSKYVGKGHYTRTEEMKGKQLIRYGNGLGKYHSMKFSWVGGVARNRREVLAQVAANWGVPTAAGLPRLNYILGSRWQHWAKDQILACCCFGGTPLGKKTREFIEAYAANRWGIKVQFGVLATKNEVVLGYDPWETFTPRQLYEKALHELILRVEEIEEFQYDMPFQG